MTGTTSTFKFKGNKQLSDKLKDGFSKKEDALKACR